MLDQSHYKSEDFKRVLNNEGALINTNNQALQAYKKTKASIAKLNKIDAVEQRLDNIEKLLMQLLESKLN